MSDGGDGGGVSHIGASDADLEPGQVVGEYRVIEKIGEGGFGTVFRAEHPLIGKEVAIKVLARQFSSDPEMVSRFVAEARAVNQIRHRNIIDIFSFGQLEDGRHYYIMEYLAGCPLDEYIERAGGPIGVRETVDILRGVALALDAAHAKGIAHRDLKPENIFLVELPDAPPFPKLLDFGIAKLLSKEEERNHKTRTGAPIGTPMYMSPEQCRGRGVDHRTDIYAFGIVCYEMITGAVPFDGETFMDILLKQMNEEPTPPSTMAAGVPASLDAPILAMLAKESENRPGTLIDGLKALEAAASGAGIRMPTASLSEIREVSPRSNHVSAVAKTVTPAQIASVAASTHYDSAPTAKRSTNRVLAAVVAVAALLVGGVIVTTKLTREPAIVEAPSPPAPSAPVRATPSPPAPEPAVALADAAPAAPELPAYVELTLVGAPDGTEVFGPGGVALGVLPEPIQLPRSDDVLRLTLRKEGYRVGVVSVSPAADGQLEVELERRPQRRRNVTRKKNSSRKKGGRHTIERPDFE